jgi:hypothetical protein
MRAPVRPRQALLGRGASETDDASAGDVGQRATRLDDASRVGSVLWNRRPARLDPR